MALTATAFDVYRCTPRQARRAILRCIEAGLVPFIKSSPGLGKSTIVRSIAVELLLALIDHRLSTSAPEDLSGLPDFITNANGRMATFAPFDIFPLEHWIIPDGKDGWLIFLDEANSAEKAVQAASYKLVLDKMVGQHRLHPNVRMVMAGNLETDRALVNPLSTAMQSRVVHIEMIPDLNEWMEDVALPLNYDERIIAYMNYKGVDALMDFRPDHTERTFNCPRTWEFMNAHLTDLQGNPRPIVDEDAQLFAGTITSGSAVDFVQFTKVYKNLIRIEDILRDPNLQVPNDPATKWAIVSHLVNSVDEKTLGGVAPFVGKMGLEFRILFFRSCLVRKPELRRHPDFSKSMVELSRYLHATPNMDQSMVTI